MIVTDSTLVEAGINDFIFVCKRQPFAITCSPYLPKIPENYVDLDLVMKLNIPIKNLQCTRLTYAGQFTKVVGQIRQTIQCMVAGKTIGTTHLKAKVVRELNKLFHADCLASQQLYHQLMDPANPSINTTTKPKTKTYKGNHNITSNSQGNTDIYTNISTVVANDDCVNFNSSQDIESVISHDSDLASAASFVDEDYFLQQRELQHDKHSITSSMADLLASTTKEKHYDRNLGYYGAITDSMESSMIQNCDIRPRQFGSSLDPKSFPTNPNIQPSPRAPPDQSYASDTAEFFCRLCSVSNQPDIVTFSHNLLNPSCPSMDENTDMIRDTSSDVTTAWEDDFEE